MSGFVPENHCAEVRGSIDISLMRAHTRFFAGLALLLWPVLGCTRAVSIEELIDAGEANMLLALSEYSDRRLVLSGEVVSAGIKKQKREVADHYGSESVLKTRNEYHPYVLLKPSQGNGRLLCFLNPKYAGSVSTLKEGHVVMLTGKLTDYTPTKTRMNVVLNDCELREG